METSVEESGVEPSQNPAIETDQNLQNDRLAQLDLKIQDIDQKIDSNEARVKDANKAAKNSLILVIVMIALEIITIGLLISEITKSRHTPKPPVANLPGF